MRTSRRILLKAVAVLLPVVVGAPAVLAQPVSAVQQIKEKKLLRPGVTSGDPWYYKDPMSEKWSGVGVALSRQMAADLGVELGFVETTWGNAVAAIQPTRST